MKSIAVYSVKGGVGKTTLAVNLAWCAAKLSARKTLLWDLDGQAAASFLLGGWTAIPSSSLMEAMAERQPIGSFAPRSPAARATGELWRAIETRLARKNGTEKGG